MKGFPKSNLGDCKVEEHKIKYGDFSEKSSESKALERHYCFRVC